MKSAVAWIKSLAWVEYLKNMNLKEIRFSLPEMRDEERNIIDEALQLIEIDLCVWETWMRTQFCDECG